MIQKNGRVELLQKKKSEKETANKSVIEILVNSGSEKAVCMAKRSPIKSLYSKM
jgi:hypothetical protein